MTGGFPLLGSLGNAQSIATSGAAPTQLSVPGGVNSKGAYTQLVASTASDTCAILLTVATGPAAGAISASVDLAIGAGGSEQIIAADLFFSIANSGFAGIPILLPLQVPSGSRIAARYQITTIIGTALYAQAVLFDGGFTQSQAGASIDALGFTAASTSGAALTPGAASAKGAYAQLIASTTADYAGFIVQADFIQYAAGANIQIDIAIGAAASEKIILPDLYMYSFQTGYVSSFIPLCIPSGSRVSARCASGSATTPGVVLAAVRQ